MFSERYRKTKIVLILIGLLSLGFYADLKQDQPLLDRYLFAPMSFVGRKVPIHLEPKVIKIGPGRIRLRQLEKEVDIFIPEGFTGVIPDYLSVDDIRPGQYVEAVTIVDPEGDLRLQAIRIAYLRPAKIAVSVIPAVIVIILLILSTRWDRGRVVIKESELK